MRNYDDFSHLLQYKYTIKDFRDIMKRFDFPKCNETKRNKIQMFCTNMIFLSQHSIKIQKLWRNHFIRSYNKTLGPSYRKFELSNNIDDFLTTEKIKDIDYYYSNTIARASKTMSECRYARANLKKTGTEG